MIIIFSEETAGTGIILKCVIITKSTLLYHRK